MSENEFVVIGAGLPRTGTNSTQVALQMLLGGKCYHMFELMQSWGNDPVNHWRKALKGKATESDWNQLLTANGFTSGVDYPISFHYKELMKVYPNAKVVLTVRSPESWHNSVKEAIYETQQRLQSFPSNIALALFRMKSRVDVANDYGWAVPDGHNYSMFSSIEAGYSGSKEFFESWVEDVKASVPKDRLLIFQVKEGWEPLCKFLGKSVPNEPFPKVNDLKSMKRKTSVTYYLAWIMVIFGFPFVLLYLVFKYY